MNSTTYWSNNNLNYCPPQLANLKAPASNIIIIDDFLDDPDQTRKQLLSLRFAPPINPKTGVVSFNALTPDNILSEIQPKLSEALNKKIEYHPRTKCAATFKSIPPHSICHVDGGDGMKMFNWTVIIYMNPPEQCQGGTVLYRHLPTGHSCNHLGIQYYKPDFKKADKWEVEEKVPMKFNRALLCPAWRFHSLEYTFGNTIKNARLTINPKVIAY
jgi:hypothetical protein